MVRRGFIYNFLDKKLRPIDKKKLDIEPAQFMRQVNSFVTKAYFIVKDSQLGILDVTKKGKPTPIYTISKKEIINSEIAVSGNNIFVNHKQKIYCIKKNGDIQLIANLLESSCEENINLNNYYMNWFFCVNAEEIFYYFSLISSKNYYMAKLDLSTKKLYLLDFNFFPRGVDVDIEADIVYALTFGGIIAKSYYNKTLRKYPLSQNYSLCKLSSDRKFLLLSNRTVFENNPIALLELSMGKISKIPCFGSNANWGTNSTVFFLREENMLWRYQFGEKQPNRLFMIPRKIIQKNANYAKIPCLSRDKSLLAWNWSVKRKKRIFGTILVDLHRNEYLNLDGWWHNVQWYKPK